MVKKPIIRQRPKILILGDFSLSTAQGAHVGLALAKPLTAAGFTIELLASHLDEAGIRDDLREYTSYVAPDVQLDSRWRLFWARLSGSGNGRIQWLEKAQAEDFCAVIAYPESVWSVGFLFRLQRLCRTRDWKLIVVVGEWFGLRWSGWTMLPRRLLTFVDWETQLRILNKRSDRIIVVSSLLEQYYRKSGCDVMRVPPLIDAQAERWRVRPIRANAGDGLTLLYTGSWSRDRLDIVLKALLRLRRDGHDVVLEFLGSGPNELRKNPKLQRLVLQAPPGSFRFHGWVPFQHVLPITASVDFGVLLRNVAKWSSACFPSRVAELQALGVPMLCNFTSDLREYLEDGKNALIVPELSVNAFETTVKRALAMTRSERDELKRYSYACAATRFEYRDHVSRLGEFIDSSLGFRRPGATPCAREQCALSTALED
jgi:glycosyltransferase involved in cell wall biosynthesis